MLLSLCACNAKEGTDNNEGKNVVDNTDALSNAATTLDDLRFNVKLPEGVSASGVTAHKHSVWKISANFRSSKEEKPEHLLIYVSDEVSGTEIRNIQNFTTYKYYSIASMSEKYYLAWNVKTDDDTVGYLAEYSNSFDFASLCKEYFIDNATENTDYTQEFYSK